MAWTNLLFTSNQVLTAARLNNLQGNFGAIANHDSGAPKINMSNSFNFSTASYSTVSMPSSGGTAYIPEGAYLLTVSSLSVATGLIFEMYRAGFWRGNTFEGTVMCICDSGHYRFRPIVAVNGQLKYLRLF